MSNEYSPGVTPPKLERQLLLEARQYYKASWFYQLKRRILFSWFVEVYDPVTGKWLKTLTRAHSAWRGRQLGSVRAIPRKFTYEDAHNYVVNEIKRTADDADYEKVNYRIRRRFSRKIISGSVLEHLIVREES